MSLVDGVGPGLDEVLRRSHLTPAQAAAAAADLLAELDGLAADGDGAAGPVRVALSFDGRVRALRDPRAPPMSPRATLQGIAGAVVHTGPPAEAPLTAALARVAERAGDRTEDTSLPALAALLPGPPPEGSAVRRELGALAVALSGRTEEPARPAVPGGVTRSFARAGRRARRRRTLRRALRTLVVGALLAAALAGGYVALHRQVAADFHRLVGSRPARAARAGAVLPLAPAGPAAAGFVTAVAVRPLATCGPGASCPLAVVVDLQPQPRPETLSWRYVVVDRCGGSTADLPGASATAPAGAPSLVVLGRATLPNWALVSLSAVVRAPVRAASAPLPLPPTARACPAPAQARGHPPAAASEHGR